ncbi:MAG: glycosyltransferase family 39 protein [Candidatus Omnitrophica bacterium]|nr:glycosyltransferase family 39 protein [Candidatus Omnitrophota bacterium]
MRKILHPDDYPILALVVIKILLHSWVNFFDGVFRDELYYIACGQHLDFGYVDHPPLVALIAACTRFALGDSIFALRIPAMLAGALSIFLTARLTRALGGGRYAQFTAALTVLLAPVYLAMSSYLSMNVFDILFWLLGAYLLILIIQEEKTKYWLLFGVVMGLGLQNKISVLFFGFGIFTGIVLTQNRRWLAAKWIWISGLTAGLIFLPHILWQIAYGWPTLEFIYNATKYKNVHLSASGFLTEQVLILNPLFFPLWALGLCWCFFSKEGNRYRLFGWAYIAIVLILVVKSGKPYYLAPIYTILFAMGAACLESIINKMRIFYLKPIITVYLTIFGILIMPMALPILPEKTFMQYSSFLGIKPSAGENKEQGPLPQFFADRYGWKETAEAVGKVYHTLSDAKKEQCVIVAGNYGQAGAIDYFGAKQGLPNAISAHNSYHLWGPGEKSGEIAIAIGIPKNVLENLYDIVEEAAVFDHKYAMPYERHKPIYLCKGLKASIQRIWPQFKNYS